MSKEEEIEKALEQALDRCGEVLMTKVRDKAILDWDQILSGFKKGTRAEKAKVLLARLGKDELGVLASLIPDIVDTTMHHLLWTLERGEGLTLRVKTDAVDVSDVTEISDGLAGELYTEDGWIRRFSKQRGPSLT